MNILVLIPARMGSSRFPGKPMAPILGKPMIGHVYDNIRVSPLVTLTAVATCDLEIFDYIESIGGVAVMTSDTHERASDRCAEALLKLEQLNGVKYEIVVMVQGDEPMTSMHMLEEAITPMLSNESIEITNLLGEITSVDEFDDRNCIKVVCDLNMNAIYFSREPIPTSIRGGLQVKSKQVCVIPFRRNFLLEYTSLSPTPLEIIESIDMLRILEHGMKVKMVPTKHQTFAVDTPDDLVRVEKIMREASGDSVKYEN
jgi:3-deoxy-manno-octulosonate cytidylyltransferase (CMP-KDO synthetase)